MVSGTQSSNSHQVLSPRIKHNSKIALDKHTKTTQKVKDSSKSCFKRLSACFTSLLKKLCCCFKTLNSKKENTIPSGIPSDSSNSPTKESSEETTESTKPEDLLDARLKNLNNLRNQQLSITKPKVKTPVKKASPQRSAKREKPAHREREKVKIRGDANASLEKITASLNLGKPTASHVGLPNIGNSCYMNASLQHIEANLSNDEAFHSLLKKPLTRNTNESLTAFETRVLKEWAPLTKQPKESTQAFEDRILFKLSFLIVMQAKNVGASKSILTDALNTHRNIFFGLKLHPEFHNGMREQKDAETFHIMWFDVLELKTLQKYYRNKVEMGGIVQKHAPHSTPLSMLQLPMASIRLPKKVRERIEAKVKTYEKQKHKEIQDLKHKVEEQVLEIQQKADAINTSRAKRAAKKEIEKLQGNLAKEEGRLYDAIEDYSDRLELEVKNKVVLNGLDIVNAFFADEVIKDFKYRVGSTKQAIPTTRKTRLENQLPDSFVLQFERFDSPKGIERKLQNPIILKDMMQFDLKPYIRKPDPSAETRYELNGIVVHEGRSPRGGHYVSYVKKGSVWYLCDDYSAKKIDVRKIPFETAYLCSYTKMS